MIEEGYRRSNPTVKIPERFVTRTPMSTASQELAPDARETSPAAGELSELAKEIEGHGVTEFPSLPAPLHPRPSTRSRSPTGVAAPRRPLLNRIRVMRSSPVLPTLRPSLMASWADSQPLTQVRHQD